MCTFNYPVGISGVRDAVMGPAAWHGIFNVEAEKELG